MPKRDAKQITLGSGKVYLVEYDATMPTVDTICVDTNLLGYIKGGATLTYTEEVYTESDDLGYVTKVITTNEEVLFKLGLITWNGGTLAKLIDRSTVTEASGKRTTKIGGAGNAKGTSYVVCFAHTDTADGNVWVLLQGRNQAGATLTFAQDAGTLVEPEFRALPHDEDGTLVKVIEEIPIT